MVKMLLSASKFVDCVRQDDKLRSAVLVVSQHLYFNTGT